MEAMYELLVDLLRHLKRSPCVFASDSLVIDSKVLSISIKNKKDLMDVNSYFQSVSKDEKQTRSPSLRLNILFSGTE